MEFNSYRSTLVSTTSALALVAASTLPAFAQQAAGQQAQSGIVLEEIIVNARRVEENIQRVPIAVTAFTPEKLAAQDVKDIWSLTKSIGGLNICCSPGTTSYIFLRGIGNGAPTYFNDVPTISNGYSNFFDISSVQVLKGPQGTLFGQASNAGAIVYQPKRPGDTLGGYVNITGGNYGRRSIEAALDVPVVEDKLLLRLAAQSYYREGIVTDIRNNKDLGDQNYYILRPSVVFNITDDIDNYTMFQLTKDKSTQLPFVLTDINFSSQSLNGGPIAGDIRTLQAIGNVGGPFDFLGVLAFGAPPSPTMLATFNSLRDQVLARQIRLGPYKVDGFSTGCSTPLGPSNGPGLAGPVLSAVIGSAGSGSGTGPIANLNYARAGCVANWTRDFFVTNATTWNFADKLSVKNIFGFRTSHSYMQSFDVDGTPLILFDSGSPKNSFVDHGTPVWSDEIQLQGTKIFDFLDFTVGTFHSAQRNHPRLQYGYILGITESASRQKNSEIHRGVYGQGNFDIGHFNESLDGLVFTAGYRYTWDTVKAVFYRLDPRTLAQTGIANGGTPDGAFRGSSGSYTFGLQYQYTPDIMFFLTNAKGYSSGGRQNVVGFATYDPDSLNSIEGGIKGTFDVGDMKVRTNVSYYHGWYSNIKANVTQIATAFPGDPPNLIVVTQNAAKGTISGLDSDITIVPTDWLEVGGIFAYTRAIYTKWDSINVINGQPVNLASTPFSFTPKFKWILRGTVRFPVDQATWGDMSLTANYTHTGSMYNVAKPVTPTIPGNPNTGIIKSTCRTAANGYGPLSADGKCVGLDLNVPYHNLDLNFDWRDVLGHEGLSAGVFLTNVTKNTQNDGGCYCNVALGLTSPTPQVPRMFGIKLGYTF